MVKFIAREYRNSSETGKVEVFQTEDQMLAFLETTKQNGELYRGEKLRSKLAIKREQSGLSIVELAEKSAVGGMAGCSGHMKLTIEFIETGKVVCPKPRKTYEYAALAKALKCTVDELID